MNDEIQTNLKKKQNFKNCENGIIEEITGDSGTHTLSNV